VTVVYHALVEFTLSSGGPLTANIIRPPLFDTTERQQAVGA